MRVVAIDQGTSSTRAFVLADNAPGEIVCTRAHKQTSPNPGWVEHDAEELLANIRTCLQAAGPVDAIGIDNQGESCLAWDAATGKPISPVIVWQDRRTEGVIAGLKADGVAPSIVAKSGLPLDPYFSAAKLGWIFEHVPQAQKLHAKGQLRLGTTDAYFLDQLTGHFATDISTASRTSLLNLHSGQWDRELCDIFGVPIDALPEIRPTMGNFGTIELNGHPTQVAASVVDQQASLYGHGCRKAGDAKITFGTGAFALVLAGGTKVPVSDNGLLPTIAWQAEDKQPVYALEGGIYCAGSAIDWAKSLGLFSDFTEINTFTARSAISRGLAFVPSLIGLGCPHWDGSAAGLWIGMALNTSAKDLVQAILEGIAFRTGEVVAAMAAEACIGDIISIDGGLSANPYFCQFLADVLQKQVIVNTDVELTALGTAMMAAGHTDQNVDMDIQRQQFTPGEPLEGEKARFAEAISRARGWNPQI